MDLLSSGPSRPRRPARSWDRRGVRVAAAVLAAVAALVLLRLTVDTPAVDRPAAAATPTPVPPPPTFDRLPGRTPIPDPAQTGDLLSGPLPPIGPPTAAVARQAIGLILGRYCADLGRFTVRLEPDTDGTAADYHHLDALVTDRLFTDSGPAMRLTLDYHERAYRWLGPLTLLRGC
ncbi:MAG TPA: hypothetical protein VLM05_17480 [Mycobacteriales bacterium]|nr:hypothetical protein [Mycobacteriales bacterium]